jgi:DNA polymerase-3 subunit delta
MRLRPEQLEKQLAQQLAPVYLISGEETLLAQECADTLRRACRQQGFGERRVLHVDASFDWQQLRGETSALSLFAERKLIELRMPGGKPGDKGAAALEHYCRHANPDTVLLILSEKPDARSKWYKAIDAAGVTVQVWPVDAAQLPRWIEQRLRARGLSASGDAVQLLAERVQGNLLAAAQEIEKLQLYTDAKTIDVDTVAATVGDSARYNAFALADQMLAGQTAAGLRALAGLRGEAVEAPVVLWALTKELRVLYRCAELIEQGQSADRAMAAAAVWDRRKPLVKQALQRLRRAQIGALLQLARRVDAAVKGAAPDDPWQLLDQLLMGATLPATAAQV